ncbi:MAG: hypothetical protein CL915_06600 [Deltaproteobacteria bacterium]|nr:hypothetical protein [Deltaproteobacteria bacterium]
MHVTPPRTGQLSSSVQQLYYDHLRSLGLSDSSINSSVRSVCICSVVRGERTSEAPRHTEGIEGGQEEGAVLQCRTNSDHAGVLQEHTR